MGILKVSMCFTDEELSALEKYLDHNHDERSVFEKPKSVSYTCLDEIGPLAKKVHVITLCREFDNNAVVNISDMYESEAERGKLAEKVRQHYRSIVDNEIREGVEVK